MKNKIFTVIEMGDAKFSIIQGVQGAEGLTLYLSEQIAGLDEETIGKNIAAKLKSNKNWKNHRLCVTLPRRLFIFKNFLFPSHSDAEIKKMITLQLPTHIPYKDEETVWDYIVLEKIADGYSRVLMIAVSLDTIKRYLHMFSSHSINPLVITISSWGLVGWLRLSSSRISAAKGMCMVLHVEPGSTEICFCDKEKFYFSRQISFGSRDLEKGPVAEFLEQVKLSMAAYIHEKMGPELKTAVIIAPGAIAQVLEEQLKSAVKFPIMTHDPALEPIKIISARAPTVQLPEPVRDVTSLAGLGTMAVDFKELSNFLPVSLRDSQDLEARFRKLLRTSTFIAIAVLSFLAAIGVEAYQKSRELAQIRQKINQISASRKAAEGQLRQWEALRKGIIGRAPVMELFDELDRLTPMDVTLTSIRLSGSGELTLQGMTPNGLSVNQFQTSLVGSLWLKNVTLQYATKRVTAVAGEVTYFLINATIQPRANELDKKE